MRKVEAFLVCYWLFVINLLCFLLLTELTIRIAPLVYSLRPEQVYGTDERLVLHTNII